MSLRMRTQRKSVGGKVWHKSCLAKSHSQRRKYKNIYYAVNNNSALAHNLYLELR